MSELDPRGADDRAPEAGWSEPVTLVAGDRLCTGCGFNLAGRPVAREPRYGLLLARCPHCGQVAPMEAHPALGAWIARWSMLGAALWLVLLIGMALAGVGFTVGFTIAASIEPTEQYERDVRNAYRQWAEGREEPTSASSFAEFWASGGSEMRPTIDSIEWDELFLLLLPMGAAILTGAFWSLALLSWRRRRLLAVGIGVVLAVDLLLVAVWLFIASMPMVASEQAAWVRMWMPMTLASGVLVAAGFLASLVLTRSVVRTLVRALVPPGLRGALAILWTAEGLEPPEPPRGVWARREVVR